MCLTKPRHALLTESKQAYTVSSVTEYEVRLEICS